MSEGISDTLLAAYANTDYMVSLESDEICLKVGEVNSELSSVLRRHNTNVACHITAYNPFSVSLSDVDNIQRNHQLSAELGSFGYVVFSGRGCDRDKIWPPEPSFLVVGLTEQDAFSLAIKYGQNAFLCVEVDQPVRLVITGAIKC